MKVLYPTDGSQTAKAALEFAVDIAKAQEGSILVLSVAEKVGAPTGEWEDMEKTLLDFAKDFSEQAVKEIKKRGVEAEDEEEAVLSEKHGFKISSYHLNCFNLSFWETRSPAG